jgi:hypothetical protein
MRLALPLILLAATAVVVSLLEGTPARLPGVALDSTVLLHLERATAVFAIVVAMASVLREAARGRLPTQLSTAGLAYETEMAGEVDEAMERLQVQIDDLQRQVNEIELLDDGWERW